MKIEITEEHRGWRCTRLVFLNRTGKRLLDAAIWLAERIR